MNTWSTKAGSKVPFFSVIILDMWPTINLLSWGIFIFCSINDFTTVTHDSGVSADSGAVSEELFTNTFHADSPSFGACVMKAASLPLGITICPTA